MSLTITKMVQALEAAGFPGAEIEGEVIHARLYAAGVEFQALPDGEAWQLVMSWPVRLPELELAAFNAQHAPAVLDVYRGEARLRLGVQSLDDLRLWEHVSDAAVLVCTAVRRRQRAGDEGM